MARKIAEVLWEDAWVECEDFKISKASSLKPVIRTTVGFLVSKNDKCLVLATDIYQNNPKIVNTVMVIPWSAILGWWVYE
jgi:hypothetical protein